jgi:hypothetical protein
MVDSANQDRKKKEEEGDDARSRKMSVMSHQTIERKTRRMRKVVFKDVDYGNPDEKKLCAERNDSTRRGALAPRKSSVDSMLSLVARGPSVVRRQGFFLSRTIAKANIEKSWITAKGREREWGTILPLIGIILGLCLAGGLVYLGISSVTNHTYCEVLIENFDSPTLDSSVWTKEVQLGGFGYVSLRMCAV